MPWGQGGTPLKEVLQTMKRNKYKFPASIEFEYQTPEGSDVLTEVKKCLEFCRAALA
jgi:sugar phosphate isomerase/epimerase